VPYWDLSVKHDAGTRAGSIRKSTRSHRTASLPFLAILLACIALHAGAAEVSGLVRFEGSPPKQVPIDTKADKYCLEMHKDAPLFTDEATIGARGEFAWIFVWIDNPPKGDYPVPTEPVTLDQFGCKYVQSVFGIRVGQTLRIVNADKTTHNVRGFPKYNRIFNFGQQPGLPPRTRVFDKVEMPMKIKCDVHAWMKAHCFVMDHPFFAVTGLDGRFTIQNLPPGTYTLKAWHERLGELAMPITVTDAAPSEAEFIYKRVSRPVQ